MKPKNQSEWVLQYINKRKLKHKKGLEDLRIKEIDVMSSIVCPLSAAANDSEIEALKTEKIVRTAAIKELITVELYIKKLNKKDE